MADFSNTVDDDDNVTMDVRMERFRASPLAPPSYTLPGMPSTLEGLHFDPALHLQLEPPTLVKDLNFQDIPFPYSPEQAFPRYAYTSQHNFYRRGVQVLLRHHH